MYCVNVVCYAHTVNSTKASSGKDRRICIWRRDGDPLTSDSVSYQLSAAVDSAHKRIVWSVHFCPFQPNILASGSRDGLVKIWHVVETATGTDEMKLLLRSSAVGEPLASRVALRLVCMPLTDTEEE